MYKKHNRPRILYVAAESAFFVTHRLPLAMAARKAGYEVHVATPGGRMLDEIHDSGLRWHKIAVRRKTRLLSELGAVPNLALLYARVQPDIVHHIAIKAVLYGTIAARFARVPAVVNAVCGLGYAFGERRGRSIESVGITFAFGRLARHPRTRTIFQNEEDRQEFIDRAWIRGDDSVLIRGSGVDMTRFSPSTEHLPDPPLVLFASRLLASKGVREFTEAARIVRERGIEARFAIAGEPDPDNPDSITHHQLSLWCEERMVEIWGRRSDMLSVMRQASLFVLPTHYREGVPKVLIEAAAVGVPAITTDTPGCRDIVLAGQTGLLVPIRNPQAVADAVIELLGDPERRAAMGRRAREHAVARFSLDYVVRATLDVYQELLG